MLNENQNVVLLEELEFNPIHKIINYKNNLGELKHITIFNLNSDQEQQLLKILMEYGNVENNEVKFNVPAINVLQDVLPILTDIQLPEDKESIERIINNPNNVLKEVLLEVTKIITETIKLNFKSLQITKDSLEQMGIDDNKLIELVDKQEQIKSMEIELEKEKQLTLQEQAKTNEEVIKQMAKKINKLESEKIEILAENEKLKEPKPKRKYNKKKKVEDVVVESKEETKTQ